VVEAHLDDDGFSVEALADELGLSRSQLNRRLKEMTGQTSGAFLRGLRLERAAQLLAAQAGTVSEVAYAVGFCSLSHFSKRFREHFGVLPSAYEAPAA
jgi:AraC-like DNA-binding protein